LKYVGDTNTSYDPTGHALLVVEGNFETEKPSAEQIESLKKLTAWLSSEHNVAAANIRAHNDFAQTVCPGRNLKALLPAVQRQLR
jgi:N-acetyl-anhydromuramyl-L-alanine amidase AmpD